MGQERFELPTSRLSGVCSNQLSYRPVFGLELQSHFSKNRVRRSLKTEQQTKFVRDP